MGSVSETPQLSIIVPVLNEALGMPEMLARLQPCRHESCEIIVVDGGSSDNTVQLATGLADQIATSPKSFVDGDVGDVRFVSHLNHADESQHRVIEAPDELADPTGDLLV